MTDGNATPSELEQIRALVDETLPGSASSRLLETYTALQHLKVAIGNLKIMSPGCSRTLEEVAIRLEGAIAKTGVTP